MRIAADKVVVAGMALMMACLGGADAVGTCRENETCLGKEPKGKGDVCKCWSTCSVSETARQCDNANPEWSGYRRENLAGSDVGCSAIPFMTNARDMCVWYYNGTDWVPPGGGDDGEDDIGLCREDSPCLDDTPVLPGQTCKCWSTCNVAESGRKCDNQNPAWSTYEREALGGSAKGCTSVPFATNARDMCVWRFDGETWHPEAADQTSMLRQKL